MSYPTVNIIKVWRTSGKSLEIIGASPRTTASKGDRYVWKAGRADTASDVVTRHCGILEMTPETAAVLLINKPYCMGSTTSDRIVIDTNQH